MSMIERVAKALQEVIGSLWAWEEMPPEVKALWFLYARAAIKALREPTDEMGYAGSEASVSTRFDSLDAKSCWQAMVDAALNEEQDDQRD